MFCSPYTSASFESGFHLSNESNSHLLWYCITSLNDWFSNLAPLSQPIRINSKPIVVRSDTETSFPRFAPVHVSTSGFHGISGLSVSFIIGQSDNFDCGFTPHN